MRGMVKVLSVSDDVYEALKSLKREGESFTEVLRRLVRKTSISEFSGVLSKETAEDIEKSIEALNRKMKLELER
jgi:predicted CopG family antitoxin